MINGSHVIVYSTQVEADRAFFRDVLKLPHVDVGHGWLIFGLPPAEIAVHPSGEGEAARNGQELYLMCADVNRLVDELQARNIACSEIRDQGWGRVTTITLPSGGSLGAYQPRHPRPAAP